MSGPEATFRPTGRLNTTIAMKKSLRVSVLAAAIAATLPSWVGAAGLGGINVFSALGQPLRAEIELQAAADELDGMTALVPGPEAFREAGLPFSSLMQDLEITIDRSSTRPVLRVNSRRAVNEPFIDMLVELSWAAGRVTREYTLLLDPVERRPAATSSGQRRTQEPAASGGGGVVSDQHRVRSGETLHRIAVRYMPQGAQLEQMLIALLRANEHAFSDGNINRLRANARLDIPDADAVAAVSVVEAQNEVREQAQAFEVYRRRVAGAAAARAPSPEPTPSTQREGRVEARVEEVVRDETAGDQVQVSGAPIPQTPAQSDAPAPAADIPPPAAPAAVAAEEDLVVIARQLDEANSRIAELETTIRDMQRAFEMNNRLLAEREGAPAASEAPAAEERPRLAPRPATPPPAPAAAQPSMLESLAANPILLGGGALVLALLALLGIRVARRRREEAEFMDSPAYAEPHGDSPSVVSVPGGERVDTDTSSAGPSSVLDTDFSQTGLSAIDANEGVDPVAEADVYLAYGRDAQAEEILLDALKVDASRHAIYLKLLEVYEQREDRKQFEAIATDLYGRTGGEGADWEKALTMGRRVDPDNPLYGGSGNTTVPPAGGASAGVAAVAATAAIAEERADDASGVALPELDAQPDEAQGLSEPQEQDEIASLDFDFDSVVEEPETLTPADSGEAVTANDDDDGNMLAFDLELGDDTPPAEASGDEPQPAGPAEAPPVAAEDEPASGEESTYMDLEKTEFDANVLDFDLDLSPPAGEEGGHPSQAGDDMDLSTVDPNLDEVQASASATADEAQDAESAGVVPEFAAEDVQREMDTKLELARAYDEMGDREGARELLEEVVKEGSPEQREAAERMLEKLA